MLLASSCKQEMPPRHPPMPVRTAMVQAIAIGTPTKYSASIVPYSQVDLAFQSSGYMDQCPGEERERRNAQHRSRRLGEKGTVLAVVRQDRTIKTNCGRPRRNLHAAQAEHEKAKLSFDRSPRSMRHRARPSPTRFCQGATRQHNGFCLRSGGSGRRGADCACILLAASALRWMDREADMSMSAALSARRRTASRLRIRGTVKAVFGVPDTSISRVKVGQPLTISTDALPQPFRGRVTAISPSADPKSRVFSVEVTIDNPKNQLKSGMIASLTLDGAHLPQSVSRRSALRGHSRSAEDGRICSHGRGRRSGSQSAHVRSVQLGNVYGNMIGSQQRSAVREKVITSGVTLIKSGDKVRVIP